MMCRAGAVEKSQQQTGGQALNAVAEEQVARGWGKVK